ncbi:MAG: NEW3 domain-containing protein [Candidatus Humimicrobiaceae bacterium]
MIRNRRKLLMLIPAIFTIFTIILLFPSLVFAQEEDTTEEEIVEPETLTFDMNYSEVNAYGIIGERFEFKVDVTIDAPEDQYFELEKEIPPGWSIVVNPGSLKVDVPLLKLKPGKKESLTIICRPLIEQEPGEYVFKLTLKSAEEGKLLQESVEFKALVKSVGVLSLTTSTGMLNTEVRPDRDNIYTLLIENTGTAPVEDISVTTPQEPEGWQVEFEDKIDILQVGEKMEIEANIIPPNRTIAGDYSIRFLVTSGEDTDFLDLRTVVQTPLIWRILGIALIAFVIAGIAVVFERLGRR